jgi:AcrR family transcriptional regulator
MATQRARNPRGEGARLRDEILDAARLITEEHGEQAVTLRSVARSVGIAAPSIYAHFPDRDAILDALVDEAFAELSAVISAARAAQTDPLSSLRAGCAAYVDFAIRRPHQYQLAFGDRERNTSPRASATAAFEGLVNSVQACVEAGASSSTDPFGDAIAIWVALHGYATMHASRPAFPWPATDTTLDRIVDGLAGLSASPSIRPR